MCVEVIVCYIIVVFLRHGVVQVSANLKPVSDLKIEWTFSLYLQPVLLWIRNQIHLIEYSLNDSTSI